MKLKIAKLSVLLWTLAITLQSCQDFLETDPESFIEPEIIIRQKSKYLQP